MTSKGSFGTLTIKNNDEQGVITNFNLSVGINVIGNAINANVRLHDANILERQCVVEVKENGLVTFSVHHIFPQTKVNDFVVLKNKKVVLNNGDVIKISNSEITYNNENFKDLNQENIPKQVKQKIFPFNTPGRRSYNLTSSSAKKVPVSFRFGGNSKQSLFSPSPLIVKKNLPPKHNDDWPSEPLDHDQFPFVGHFSPIKKERPVQEIPDTTSAFEDTGFKPLSPVNVVVPTIRTSTCTSTSTFEKMRTEEAMLPDVTNISLVAKTESVNNSKDVPVKSFHKPSVRVSTRLTTRQSSLPPQNTSPKISRRQSRSSSCVTPSKMSVPLKTRLTISEHKISNESLPSFFESSCIDSTTSLEQDGAEMNSSTPMLASRTSNSVNLLGTPTSIIKKRDSLSLNKTEKTFSLDNSEAREKSKSRLFDQSFESVDGDSLAVSTDTSSFVYESALTVLPTADDLEVEENMEDAQVSVAPISKSLNSTTVGPNDSDISGITRLVNTPESKRTTSNFTMETLAEVLESTSNQSNLSFESSVSAQDDDNTLKNLNMEEEVENYSSITISSNEDSDASNASSENVELIREDEPTQVQETVKIENISHFGLFEDLCELQDGEIEIQNTEKKLILPPLILLKEEVALPDAELQLPEVQGFEATNARIDEESASSFTQTIEEGMGDGSSLILAMEQEDELINENNANNTFTLSQTPAKITENSETIQKTMQDDDEEILENYEEVNEVESTDQIEDGELALSTEDIETVPERKSTGITLKQETPVAFEGSSTRKSKIPQTPLICANYETIVIDDSEDTDASNGYSSKSELLRIPVKNSPAASDVSSARNSNISHVPSIYENDETIEFVDYEDTEVSNTSSTATTMLITPVKNSPAASEIRSIRKSKIPQTPEIRINNDSEDTEASTASSTKSKLLRTPIKNSPGAVEVRSTRKSKIIQTPSLQFQDTSVTNERKAKRISKISKTPLFQNEEDSDGSVSTENNSRRSSTSQQTPPIQQSSVAAEVRSTRKSKIVQASLFEDNENIESEDAVVTTDRKSKRISKVFQTSLVSDSPVGSTRKSKVLQKSLLQDEASESGDSEDMGGLVLSENNSRRSSTSLQTPPLQQSPIAAEVRSTRKSKIVQTPLLEDNENVESEGESGDSEDTDFSVLTENNSRRSSTSLQTPPLQQSPIAAKVRSTRKSKIVQAPLLEVNENVESEGDVVTTDRKSKRISKIPQTPLVSNSSVTSGVRSTRKSKLLETPLVQYEESSESGDSEDMDCSVLTENNSRRSSTSLQTPPLQQSPIAAEGGSTRKSKIVQAPLLEDNENVESEGDVVTTDRKSKRISKIPQTPLVSNSSVTSGVRSTRKSKLLETPLVQYEESSESGDSEDMDCSVLTENNSRRSSTSFQTPPLQQSPIAAEGRSTRKSKIVQAPLLEDNENVESEDAVVTIDRKSKRISKIPQTPLVSSSPVTSGVESTRKSKNLQTSLLQDEEASESGDSEDLDFSVLTENNSRRSSTSLQTPPRQQSPVAAEVRSTRKSKIVETPLLEDNENVESEVDVVTTDRKSKRISKIPQTPLVSSPPVTSGVESTRKSKNLQTSLLQDEEASESSDSEDLDFSVLTENNSRRSSTSLQTPPRQQSPVAAEVRSTRKSKIVETPLLEDNENVESEVDVVTTDRKSKRISKIPQTPLVSSSPVTSGVESTRKSKNLQTSLLQDEVSESDDSEDMDCSVFTENNSRHSSTSLQSPPRQQSPVAAEVRSTRKSKIVQTPLIEVNENVESEDTVVTTDRKSKRISKVLQTSLVSNSPVTSGLRSTRKSKLLETPLVQDEEASELGDSEDFDDLVSTLPQTPSTSRSPPIAEVRSTRKSKIVQTPSLQPVENVESEVGLAEIGKKSKRISNLLKTPSTLDSTVTSGVGSTRKSKVLQASLLHDEEVSELGDCEDLDDSVFTSSPVATEVNSTRKSKILEASRIQDNSEVNTDEDIDESGHSEKLDVLPMVANKARRISELPQTLLLQNSPTPRVITTRKSKILETSALQDEEIVDRKSKRISKVIQCSPSSSTSKTKILDIPLNTADVSEGTTISIDWEDAVELDVLVTANKSTALETPTPQNSPSVVGSARKSQVLPTCSLANAEIFESENSEITAIASDRKSKRISKVPRTPSLQDTPTASGVAQTRKSNILQTPLSENETEELDTENTSEASELLQTPTVHDLPMPSGVRSTRKSKILQTPLSENETNESHETKPKKISNLLQTPTMQGSPIVTRVRSTRKSKISKTPLLLNNDANISADKDLHSTPQSTPTVSGVRSTRKSKIPITPIITSSVKTRKGSKTPMMQQEERIPSTSSAIKAKRNSKVMQTPSLEDVEKPSKLFLTPSNQNSEGTPVTSGIQEKRTSQVLKTPSMQDLSQTNSPFASGIKSKRISELQQTPSIKEEPNLSIQSPIKQLRISNAIKTSSMDFEETESPIASPSKSGNTSKMLIIDISNDQNDSEDEVESSPAPKRRRRTAETEPHNDLTNVQGVKTLFEVPKVQNQPHNDLSDVRGVKNIFKTPKVVKGPRNDLTDIKGVKKLMATPKVQNSPANDLTNVRGVKKLLATPKVQNSPANDLTNVRGVKKLLATPKVQNSPANDLTNVRGVKKLLKTPKVKKEPRDDLTDVDGVENLLGEREDATEFVETLKSATVSKSKKMTPNRGLSEARSVKKISGMKKSKVQKSPKNDLTNVVGVKKMFAEEEARYRQDFNTSGVAEMMNENDDLFNSLLDKKPPKTYGRKSTPTKLNTSVNKGVLSGTPVMSEEVVNWVNSQDFNKCEIGDNLTPIKSKNNESMAIKKKDVKIHSSTPLDNSNRGILREIEANCQKDVEPSAPVRDKNLKKVQFLDDSDLRRSKRTPRTPTKIASEFILATSKQSPINLVEKKKPGRKRKAENDDDLNGLAKVSKMVPDAKNDSVIVIDSETDEVSVARKVATKNYTKKAPNTFKKATRSNKVEEENSDENEDVEAPKTTRGRQLKKTNPKTSKQVGKVEKDIDEEGEAIEAPKTTRGRQMKKTDSKTNKKVAIEYNDQDDIIEPEPPKTTRTRAAKKTNTQASKKSIEENMKESLVEEKGESLKPTRSRKVSKKSEDEEKDESLKTARSRKVSKKSEDEENSESLKTTRSGKVSKKSEDEENGESLKTTRSRKVSKKSEDEEKGESLKTTRSGNVSKKSEDEENGESLKTTRSRKVSKKSEDEEKGESLKTTRSGKVSKKSEDEEKGESLKTTRSRKVLIKCEPEDEENDESAIEVPRKTRGRQASKTTKKATKEPVLESNEEESVIQVPKITRGRAGATKKDSVPEQKSFSESEIVEIPKGTRQRAATKGRKGIENEISINSTVMSVVVKTETPVTLPKTTRTRGIKRNLEVENLDDQEKDAKIPKTTRGRAGNRNGKKVVVEELENTSEIVAKTGLSRVKTARTSKKSIEDSEMEASKNEETNKPVRGRKIKVELQTKSEEEESKSTNTRKKRKLYSLEDSVKIENIEEVVKVEVKKRTRNVKEKIEVVAPPVRSSRRTRK